MAITVFPRIWIAPQLTQFIFLVAIAGLLTGGGRTLAQVNETPDLTIGELPRYRFQVGQQLQYEQNADKYLLAKTDGKGNDDRYEYHNHWWVWVTRHNDVSGWRLVIRKKLKNVVIRPGKEPQPTFVNDYLGYCDLTPDGSFEMNPTLGGHAYFKTHPDELIVRLPPNANSLLNGWQYNLPFEDAQHTLQVSKHEDDLLGITAFVKRPEDQAQEYNVTRRFDFDVARGFVTRIVDDYESHQANHPFHVRRTFSLTSVEQRPSDWISSFASEAETYITAQVDSDKLFEKAALARTKADCQVLMDKARERIAALRNKSKLEEIQELLAARLKLQERDAKYEVEGAAKREQLYAQPPIDWESTDFNGQKHRLDDYRGKVVLLDIWYRGCLHCVRAMPTIKKVAAHYQNKDVVVLGINIDEDEKDARHVIDSFQLSYPNLRGKEISKQYRVNGWPTFIVLDQTGRIANYHMGNSEDLYEHITGVVDQLHAQPPFGK